MLKQLERIVKIRTVQEVKHSITFVDDIQKKVLKKRVFQSLNGEVVAFGELEDFPYSHHTEGEVPISPVTEALMLTVIDNTKKEEICS